MTRAILHVDMDAFYASVEELDDPALRGRPVIVGGPSAKRGVVAAANYQARSFGVHSAMPMSQAIRLCPQGVILPVRMQRYVELSRRIHAIFQIYTPQIEPISLDEAFMDVTGSVGLFGDAERIGQEIKQQIKEQLDLIASVGIDAKHSYEDVILPITEAKRLWGDRVAVLGGVDMDLLTQGSVEQVRARVREIMRVCAPDGGFALGTGNSVANYIPVKNYLTMLDEGGKMIRESAK